MWGILFVWVVVVVGLSVYLFNKFGCFSERPKYVTAATLAGWSLSFLMAFLLPMDLASVSCQLVFRVFLKNSNFF